MKELIIKVRHWFDRVNGNHYAELCFEFEGKKYFRPAEWTMNDNNAYLHDALVLCRPAGFEKHSNECWPQVTIFCRENNISWRVEMTEVSKRQLLGRQ